MNEWGQKGSIALKKLGSTGFFHIMGSGTVNRILVALLSLVLVRILSKPEYGSYSYAYNIASFFIIFNGLGATTAVLQICSELHDDMGRRKVFFFYGYKMGVFADIGLGVVIAGVGIFAPLTIQGSNALLVGYCTFPLLMFLNEFKLTQLRIGLQNKEYAFSTNIQTVLLVFFSVSGALLFQAMGLILGQALAYALSYTYLCLRYPAIAKSEEEIQEPNVEEKREYWSIASVSAVNVGISQALSFIGIFLVGAMLLDGELVADFQAAMLVPMGLGFVPAMVITYVYPYFARNRSDYAWTVRSYGMLLGAGMLSMGTIAVVCFAFAPWFVPFIFGEQYASIVPVVQVLMVGFFLNAAFRQPTGNLLVSQRRLLFNTFNGVISIVANALLSVVLIPPLGVMGAAVSYAATMGIGSVLSVPYYLHVIRRIR